MKYVVIELDPNGVNSQETGCFADLQSLQSWVGSRGVYCLEQSALEELFEGQQPFEDLPAVPVVSDSQAGGFNVCGIVGPARVIREAVSLILIHAEMKFQHLRMPVKVLGCSILAAQNQHTNLLLSGDLPDLALEFRSDTGEHLRYSLSKSGFEVSVSKIFLPSDYVSIP